MYYGRVVGHATSTIKHPSLDGSRLLLVMALQADGRTPEGDPILVIDRLGAGLNETVLVTSDGIGTREILHSTTSPVRWSVMAIPDERQGPNAMERDCKR